MGGPFQRLLEVVQLSGPGTARLVARCVVLSGLTWLPLLVATAAQGLVVGPSGAFARDVGLHARLLVAMPLLLLAERPLGRWLGEGMRYLVDAGLVDDENRAAFDAAAARTTRLRDSTVVGLVMASLALALSWPYATGMVAVVPRWGLVGRGGGDVISVAGWWYLLVAGPLFRFLVLRWLWGLFLWTWFLGSLARARLRLLPTHPDGAGGLSAFAAVHVAFGWLQAAVGVAVAGHFTTRILAESSSVRAYAAEVAAVTIVGPLLFLAPLLVFAPALVRIRRHFHEWYGAAGADYGRAYADAWVRPESRRPLPLDAADISGHADLGASFDRTAQTRVVPFTRWEYLVILAAGAVPALAFFLQEIPLRELLEDLMRIAG